MHQQPRHTRRLLTVEAGRGLAALLVVLMHASYNIMTAPQYWHTPVFGRVFDFGAAGVQFFFVLSGFIILHVHAGDIGRPRALRRYALRRFIRIYPLYWLAFAAMLAGLVAINLAPVALHLPLALLLVGTSPNVSVVIGAWTLFHEMAFYIVFGLWIVNRRIGAAVAVLWLLLVLLRLSGIIVPGVPRYIQSPLNLLFLFGIFAWFVASRRALPRPWWLATIAALAFVAVGMEEVYSARLPHIGSQLLYGLTAAAGLAAITAHEMRVAVAVPRLLGELGAASYAIYLSHSPLLMLFAKLAAVTGFRDALSAEAWFVLIVGGTVAGGYAIHRLIERPLLAALQRRLKV